MVEFSDSFLEGSLLFLGILFGVISLASLLKLIWVFCVSRPGWSVSKVVHCLVPVTAIPTCADLFYYYQGGDSRLYFLESWSKQSPMLTLLDASPGYIFISTFILLCLFWFKVYTSAFLKKNVIQSTMLRMYLAINGVLYAFWITFMIIIFTSAKHRAAVHTVEAVFTISVTALMGIVFLICGLKLYLQLRQLPTRSQETLDIARKVGLLTVVFSVVFILRAPIIYVGFFKEFPPALSYSTRLLTPILLQALPTCLTLLLLGKKPSTVRYAKINY